MIDSFSGSFFQRAKPDEMLQGKLLLGERIAKLSLFTPEKVECLVETEFFGKIEGQKLVSLLGTVSNDQGFVMGSLGTEFKKTVEAFYCVLGACYLGGKDQIISSVLFTFGQSKTMFESRRDFCLYSHSSATPLAEALSLPDVENQLFSHFNGVHILSDIFLPNSKITFENDVRTNLGGTSGIQIDNEIITKIEFSEHRDFYDMMTNIMSLRRFVEAIIGRKQSINNLRIVTCRDGIERKLEIIAPWLDDAEKPENKTIVSDLLINPSLDREKFQELASNYISSDTQKKNVRESWQRYSQQNLSEDRLVGLANLFDLIPKETYPSKFELTDTETKLLEEFRISFKNLPQDSKSRGSILGAIGRVKSFTLRDKITFRAMQIKNAAENAVLEDIEKVIKSIHLCRNHFVHGSEPEFKYDEHWGLVQFFIETCEVIFLFSDMIECGWNPNDYLNRARMNSNRVSGYFTRYNENYNYLIQIIDFEN